jgi:hypothetical protein
MKMAKINERNFKAIYSKDSNKVFIAYGSKRVMNVINVSENYDLEGLNGMQIAELVFNSVKKDAMDVVADHLGA